ncbi:unnamed protein product [Miscanthus lutarioriparius]|uniref:Knottins-like domain-containing protein n=1 Tax=Miscanthus lutarioriparius TaxID=422564 RepID=A0A811QP91_9POAL|nr:unnamed protein product [Miscanthus lutarioriparius]
MASTSSSMVASVVVFLLLLAASEMGTTRVAEARHMHCFSQSHKFVGACLSESNYENVCKTEGFPSGECKWHGIVSKCHCKRIC